MNRVAGCIVAFVLAHVLTLATVRIEQTGPEQVADGNLCGPAANAPCLRPVLKGGFPWAYLSDTAGVSVEHRLFIEDDFDALAWWMDAALYFVALLLTFQFVARRRTAARA
jgi:hypothetical protein